MIKPGNFASWFVLFVRMWDKSLIFKCKYTYERRFQSVKASQAASRRQGQYGNNADLLTHSVLTMLQDSRKVKVKISINNLILIIINNHYV